LNEVGCVRGGRLSRKGEHGVAEFALTHRRLEEDFAVRFAAASGSVAS
jgi:hypothetical protein